MTKCLVDLQTVEHRYPRFVLGPITLRVVSGNIVAVMGRNGAGKTTLLSILSGHRSITKGTAQLLGHATTGRANVHIRDRVAIVRTRLSGLIWMSIREHFEFLSTFYSQWQMERALAMADFLGLDVTSRLSELSRGNSLKVGLCAAFGQNANLLLLDEPTAGLDPIARQDVLNEITTYIRANPNTALMLATHMLEDLEQLPLTHLLVLRNGKIVGDVGCNGMIASGGS